ncbi:MAG: hypothetical protein E6H84_06745 [Chloroflexi bacterium]|nr:MAG: hypothetical protein E6H84_06745 [Chloroflexota bacterium]
MRRAATAVLAMFALSLVAMPPARAIAADNPIVVENQQQGSTAWRLGALVADDASGQIKGYASATSVNQGDSLTIYVSVNPAQKYTIDIYRIGWYNGTGGRLRLHVDPQDGITQAPCTPDATTGLIACNWTPSYTFTVPSDWTSGIYLGMLTNAAGYENYIQFVVKDGRPAAFLYQQGINTDQAYNDYPNDGVNGKSLYTFNSYGANTISGEKRAVKVSFDRPYFDEGDMFVGTYDMYLVHWLERNGYDVTYSTDVDTHANGSSLQTHKGFLSGGHDEYWSKEMYDAVEAARNIGVNLAFFGSNAIYWQVRYEPSASGAANRVLVCYKDPGLDPVQGTTTTSLWRDPPLNRPEQALIGVQYTSGVEWDKNVPYVVTNSSHWIYQGTGFKDGDTVPGIVGYEMDRLWANYAGPDPKSQTLLSRSPFTYGGGTADYANSSIYTAPSGALVFASGTSSWDWGLDNGDPHAIADPRIQKTTANLLNAFMNGVPQVKDFKVAAAATVTAGTAFSLTVTAEDAQGNPATWYSGTVHFTSTDSSSGVALPADATLTNGTGTFSATLIRAGSQNVSATDTVTSTITGSANVTVQAAAAATLGLTAPPSATINQSFPVTVTLKDRYGNVATGYTGRVHFSTSDISPLVVLPADYTFAAADAGTKTFSVTLQTPPSQTLTVADTANASLTATAQIAVGLPLLPLNVNTPKVVQTPLPPQAGP